MKFGMPGAAAAMRHEARGLDLVHRIDHRRRAASLAEDCAELGDLEQAEALAAEALRNHDAHQPLGLERVDGLLREAAFAVDIATE